MLNKLQLNDKNIASKFGNGLYKKYGYTRKYKKLRLKEFEIGKKFTFENLEYKVIDINKKKKKVFYELLSVTDRKAPSGRPLKKRGGFGITSTMDTLLKFIE